MFRPVFHKTHNRNMKRTIQTNDHPGMDARWITQQFCLFMSNVAQQIGITHEAIAEQTGIARPNITRALNGSHVPTFQTIIRIAAVIGVKIEMRPGLPVQTVDDREPAQMVV